MDIWSEMHRMREQWDEPSSSPEAYVRSHASAWAPVTDIFTRGEDMVIQCDLPGVEREDIDISFSGGILTISGERKLPADKQQASFYVSERNYGAFRRSLTVPEDVDSDEVKAAFSDGLLEVVLTGGARTPGPRSISVSESLDQGR